MITINLLPQEKIKKKIRFNIPKIDFGALPTLPVTCTVIAILVFIQITMSVAASVKKGAYTKMTREWEMIKPEKEAAELTRRENIRAQKKVVAIEQLMQKRMSWARKLDRLSELVMNKMWYTNLYVDKKAVIREGKTPASKKQKPAKGAVDQLEIPYLDLGGEISIGGGEELAVIGKFIERLKGDEEFFKDFSNVELSSTKLHTIGSVETMKFNINCYFREAEKDGGVQDPVRKE